MIDYLVVLAYVEVGGVATPNADPLTCNAAAL